MALRIFRVLLDGVSPPRRSMVNLLARRDLRESTSDVRLAVSMIGLTFLIPLLAAGGVGLAFHFLRGQGLSTVRLIEVGAFFVVFLPASFSLVLALESFSGERERSTLESLFATPLRESEIYLGKILAVLLPAVGLSYSALLVYTVTVYGLVQLVVWRIIGPLIVTTMAQALVMVAGATIISSQTKTLRSANVMASFIIIPMSIVIQGEAVLIITRQEWILWAVAACLFVVAVLLLRLGIVNFNRESILAKDSRPPDRRAWLRRIKSWRPDFTLREFGRAFVRTRSAIVTATLLLLAGIVFGAIAQRFGLVPGRPVATLMHQQAAMGHEVVAGDPHMMGFILGHNLLTGGLMGLLAPFTLGVAGGLITLLNGFVVGYVGGVFAGFHHLGFFACGVLPHGVIEVPALVLASAFALRLGASMVRPSRDGWLRGMGLALTDYVRGMIVVVGMFTLAAFIEAFVTPGMLSHCV